MTTHTAEPRVYLGAMRTFALIAVLAILAALAWVSASTFTASDLWVLLFLVGIAIWPAARRRRERGAS